VLLALNKQLVAIGPAAAGDLAVRQQEIGAIYLNSFDKPAEATPYLLAALNYWDAQIKAVPGARLNVENLQRLTMQSYLKAKKYKDGIAFAASRIGRPNENNMEVVAREILTEIYRLDAANQLREAIDLATEAKALPLTGEYKDKLSAVDERIRQKNPGLHLFHDEWWVTILA
jgi:hypothetical protein